MARIIATAASTGMAVDSPFMLVTAVSHWPNDLAPSDVGLYCRVRLPSPAFAERIPASNIAGSARPKEICRRRVFLVAVQMTDFHIALVTTKAAGPRTRRRTALCTVTQRSVGDLAGFLPPPSARRVSQSWSSCKSDPRPRLRLHPRLQNRRCYPVCFRVPRCTRLRCPVRPEALTCCGSLVA